MPVTNIYPFARDGRLLHDVLLYANIGPVGNVGLPLSVRPGDPDRNRRLLRPSFRWVNWCPADIALCAF